MHEIAYFRYCRAKPTQILKYSKAPRVLELPIAILFGTHSALQHLACSHHKGTAGESWVADINTANVGACAALLHAIEKML